jgi:hypothetical protein
MTYLDTVGNGQLLDWKYRPLEEVRLANNVSTSKFVNLPVALSYKFTRWAALRLTYQYTEQRIDGNNYSRPESYYVRNLVNTFTNLSQTIVSLRYPVPIGGILDISTEESQSQNARAQLDVNKTLAGRHSITGLLAAEVSETKTNGNVQRLYGFNRETGTSNTAINFYTYYPLYGKLVSTTIPNGDLFLPEKNIRFASFVGNLSYNYSGRYTIYASARKDGANMFGVNTNRKWKPLWSTGLSWNLSEESFYHVKWMSSLRLRASYGYSGNPGNATGLPVISYRFGGSPLSNQVSANIAATPNPNLRWEQVRIINSALDFAIFNNRLSGSIDVFRKKSSFIIWVDPPAPSTGVATYVGNAANLSGRGFELTLSSRNTVGMVKWGSSFHLSHAKTIVDKVFFSKRSTLDYISYGINPSSGQIAYGLSSYRFAGLDPATGDPMGYLNKQPSKNYSPILADSLQNQVFHGSSIPLYFGNLGNSVSWKAFTFFANLTYRLAFYYRKPTLSYSRLAGNIGHADYALRWQKPGDENHTTVPSFIYPLDPTRDLFYGYSEVNVLRGDNIRLTDLRLQYSWPLNKSAVKSLQLSVSANQLDIIIWKKDKSVYDPDITGGAGLVTRPPRVWSGSFSVGF